MLVYAVMLFGRRAAGRCSRDVPQISHTGNYYGFSIKNVILYIVFSLFVDLAVACINKHNANIALFSLFNVHFSFLKGEKGWAGGGGEIGHAITMRCVSAFVSHVNFRTK
jgi:hypothetical protein